MRHLMCKCSHFDLSFLRLSAMHRSQIPTPSLGSLHFYAVRKNVKYSLQAVRFINGWFSMNQSGSEPSWTISAHHEQEASVPYFSYFTKFPLSTCNTITHSVTSYISHRIYAPVKSPVFLRFDRWCDSHDFCTIFILKIYTALSGSNQLDINIRGI